MAALTIELCMGAEIMSDFIWKAEYHIGDELIDQQHQYLFELANHVLASESKGALVNNVLKLYRYVRDHFSHEEGLMKECGYEDYQKHVALHNALIDKLGIISDSIGRDCWNDKEIRSFMNEWLLEHILNVDSKLGKFLQSKCN